MRIYKIRAINNDGTVSEIYSNSRNAKKHLVEIRKINPNCIEVIVFFKGIKISRCTYVVQSGTYVRY